MSIKSIEVEKAEINTATIKINTLMVNNRKLTLSVFRQIYEDSLIDYESMQLRGIPWGKVNYFWGDQNQKHIHVVWQDGHVLKRDLIDKNKHVGINLHFDIEELADLLKIQKDIEKAMSSNYEWERESVPNICGRFHKKLESLSWANLTDHEQPYTTLDVCDAALELMENKKQEIRDMLRKYYLICDQLDNLPHLMIAV